MNFPSRPPFCIGQIRCFKPVDPTGLDGKSGPGSGWDEGSGQIQEFTESTKTMNHWPARSESESTPRQEELTEAITTLKSAPFQRKGPNRHCLCPLAGCTPNCLATFLKHKNRYTLPGIFCQGLYTITHNSHLVFEGIVRGAGSAERRFWPVNRTDQTDRTDRTAPIGPSRLIRPIAPLPGEPGPIGYRLMSQTSVNREASRQLMPGSSGTSKVRTMVPSL